MTLGIMQPYFMPYIGYFQLMKAADKYIIYDDVAYIKRGWITRNNILINGEKHLFTITLSGASINKFINEIEINDNFINFLKTLKFNYTKAPFYAETMKLMEEITSFEDKNLTAFITNSFKVILKYLNIDTELILSSSLNKDCSLKGKEKIIHICELLGAQTYLNAIGGQELYDGDEFKRHNIDLKFLKTEEITYKQFKNNFVPNLSIIDVLMFNPPEIINEMLNNYKFV